MKQGMELSSKRRLRGPVRGNKLQFLPLYLMLVPGTVYLIVNNYLPMLGLVIAFKKVNYQVGILNSPWCGLDNFKFLFKTGDRCV